MSKPQISDLESRNRNGYASVQRDFPQEDFIYRGNDDMGDGSFVTTALPPTSNEYNARMMNTHFINVDPAIAQTQETLHFRKNEARISRDAMNKSERASRNEKELESQPVLLLDRSKPWNPDVGKTHQEPPVYCCCFNSRKKCIAFVALILLIIGVCLYFALPQLPSIDSSDAFAPSNSQGILVNESPISQLNPVTLLSKPDITISFLIAMNVTVKSPSYFAFAIRSLELLVRLI